MAMTKRLAPDSRAQVKEWVDRMFEDPKWVAKIKARRDSAYAQMRAMGLLNSSK